MHCQQQQMETTNRQNWNGNTQKAKAKGDTLELLINT